MVSSKVVGMAAGLLAAFKNPEIPNISESDKTQFYQKVPLSKKQLKARKRAKLARSARKVQRHYK